MNDLTQLPPIEVPASSISVEALSGLIDSFILREGTDYGLAEVSYEAKVQRIKRLLENGNAKIVFDRNTDTVTVLTQIEFKKLGI